MVNSAKILSRIVLKKLKNGVFGYRSKTVYSNIKIYLIYNLVAIDKWILNVMLGPLWNVVFQPRIKFGYHSHTMSGIMGMNILVGSYGRWDFFKKVCWVLSKIDKGHCGDVAEYELLHDTTGDSIAFVNKIPDVIQVPKVID